MTTPETSPTNQLSEREREILRLVATGASNKQIAQRLVISPNTVKVHLRNIFAKVGVASRTEATLYAIQNGYVTVPQTTQPAAAGEAADSARPPGDEESISTEASQREARPLLSRRLFLAVGGAGAFGALALLAAMVWRSATSTPTTVPALAPVRWETKATLLTARAQLATAVYDNQIFAIGGETTQGVTGVVERYDPVSDRWETARPKPVPVAEINAGVIGGRLYVPGGRLDSGEPTDVFEVYSPRTDQWEERAHLPVPLSGYALAVFEGKLYVFGGWDGKAYVARALQYDPEVDRWTELTQMPTARGHAGAAVAAGGIYVVGGNDETAVLNANEKYMPDLEGSGNPWRAYARLPEPRAWFSIASVADVVHVVGGRSNLQGFEVATPLKYYSQTNEWQTFEAPASPLYSGMSASVIGSSIHVLGGENGPPLDGHLTYQAIYTLYLPGVAK